MKESIVASSSISKRLSPWKMAFITGTLLLISTEFICRILGSFYRAHMFRTIGIEGLDIYNMVHPIFSTCLTIRVDSIQTALSQCVVANQARGKAVFKTGLAITVGISFTPAWVIYTNNHFLAEKLLPEPKCAPHLPVIAVSVPFVALHVYINGYYYGAQKVRVPVFSQVAEQIIRMDAVFLIAGVWLDSGCEITVSLTVYEHLIGEVASAAFTLFCLDFFPSSGRKEKRNIRRVVPLSFDALAAPLTVLAPFPMGNRLILNVLEGAEAVWIPNGLVSSSLTNSEVLSIYGVLASMALPLILPPSAITNSVAAFLLPTVAKAQADGNEVRVSSMISMSLRYSCYTGILCIDIFTIFGNQLGASTPHDRNADTFITILSWLYPFMYLVTIMGGILNGLEKTSVTFFQNVQAMVIRLAFVLFAISRLGILGYLWGMLASELALVVMCFLTVKRQVSFQWDTANMIIKPTVLLPIFIGMYPAFSHVMISLSRLPLFIETSIRIIFLSIRYMGLLLLPRKRKPPL